jgi:hypothetical protein
MDFDGEGTGIKSTKKKSFWDFLDLSCGREESEEESEEENVILKNSIEYDNINDFIENSDYLSCCNKRVLKRILTSEDYFVDHEIKGINQLLRVCFRRFKKRDYSYFRLFIDEYYLDSDDTISKTCKDLTNLYNRIKGKDEVNDLDYETECLRYFLDILDNEVDYQFNKDISIDHICEMISSFDHLFRTENTHRLYVLDFIKILICYHFLI